MPWSFPCVVPNRFRFFSSKTSPSRQRSIVSTKVDLNTTVQETWEDVFSRYDDRFDKPPLPLPHVTTPKRVVLVRHGQSTWNAEGRIQGSSNESVLTDLGRSQAETTREMLFGENFDLLMTSPLERSRKTAEIVWNGREFPTMELPQLREIDLYSFQGLLKDEGKQRFGDIYKDWQKRPHEFVIDSHPPVRELWYRASLAWQTILGKHDRDASNILVVAHNAVNQALICSAANLAPIYFRRFLQSNAATTVIDVQPSLFDAPRVTIDRLNQSPSPPFRSDGAGRKASSRIVLVRHGDTEQCSSDIILGLRDEPCGVLGEVQVQKTSELLLDLQIDAVITSPLVRSKKTASSIALYKTLMGETPPDVLEWDELRDWDAGEWELRLIREVRDQEIPSTAEDRNAFWTRCGEAWKRLVELADGKNLVVVTHSAVIAALLGHCLDIGLRSLSLFRHAFAQNLIFKRPNRSVGGGVTIIDFPEKPDLHNGVIRCSNYSAHLGRWSVPVTQEDLDATCGIDGCF